MQCFKFLVLLLLTSCLNALVEAKARDYYEVLSVDRSDDVKKIKKAFKKLALKYHPDKNLKNKKAAEEKFMEINNAYQVLCDPIKREKYDKSGGDTEFESKQQSHSFQGQGFSFNFDGVFQGFNEGFGGGQAFPFSHFTEQVHHSQQHSKQNYFTIHDFFQEDEDRFYYHDRGHREDHFGSRDSFFGSHFGAHGQPYRGDFHMNMQAQSRATERGHFDERMATRCRSVTQRVGDVITTFTDCS